MRMRALMRQLGIVVVLTLWVVSGPIAMAFNGCLLMGGGMCEAPCGMSSYIGAPAPSRIAVVRSFGYLVSQPPQQVALVSARPPTPPPKLALLSA